MPKDKEYSLAEVLSRKQDGTKEMFFFSKLL